MKQTDYRILLEFMEKELDATEYVYDKSGNITGVTTKFYTKAEIIDLIKKHIYSDTTVNT